MPRFQTYGRSLVLFEQEREVSVARIFRSPAHPELYGQCVC